MSTSAASSERRRALSQGSFAGLFRRALSQGSFAGLFYRALLQGSFTGLFCRALLQGSFAGLFWHPHLAARRTREVVKEVCSQAERDGGVGREELVKIAAVVRGDLLGDFFRDYLGERALLLQKS